MEMRLSLLLTVSLALCKVACTETLITGDTSPSSSLEELRHDMKTLQRKQSHQEMTIQKQEHQIQELQSKIKTIEIQCVKTIETNEGAAKNGKEMNTLSSSVSVVEGTSASEQKETKFQSKEYENNTFAVEYRKIISDKQNTSQSFIRKPSRSQEKDKGHHMPSLQPFEQHSKDRDNINSFITNSITKRRESQGSRIRRGTSNLGGIAFTARMSANAPSLRQSETIPYDRVVTNVGGDYKNTTGIFTCRVPGTYLFTWTSVVLKSVHLETYLMRNGIVEGYGEAFSTGTHYASGSSIVILKLDTGDDVWVSVSSINPSSGARLWGAWSTFSGFIV